MQHDNKWTSELVFLSHTHAKFAGFFVCIVMYFESRTFFNFLFAQGSKETNKTYEKVFLSFHWLMECLF
jgi:hypothetical protein